MAGNSNSGRPALPPFMHQMQGNRSKQSQAQLAETNEALQIAACAPEPPDWLNAAALAEWHRVVPDLLTLGWVHRLDRMQLAAYCEAVADWETFRRRIAEENRRQADAGDVQTFATGAKQISIWRQLANDAEKRANAAGAGFGFTPLARRNMKAASALPSQPELFPNDHKEAAARYFSH
ncbi:P27 family predicted phage terminase small subunit [Paracidovorax citrulli]|uniref:Phage terminase, small subunit, putative, P27 family n=3 Tax=Paracidovorax citrulli TaxID=80869 RepID=A1TML4_PARC0|nr:phage terminase, small subunit, putative, P27 family [Paracidovorax citrulli AAC00-1]ATG94781.1 phage terminase small subunit P27 family [Paracidovorax citrulli]MVT38493.1 phage terminase small subunit P27 family [Paracidovorax citrulli]PVY66395.1 P27 family predicted phage terminase small subunit [Paracidovorax citrulli]REG69434.1 P27 family predicted phage terminase small subunit [Paracidovorax citrulli]